MRKIFILVLFFGVNILHAQKNYLNPNYIPPSPTAAELGKYGAIPVSYYTGKAEINIPLYTLKVGDITLPISLSYNSGGIRVDDVASWVGLGWSLNAGGIITRTIKGEDDFSRNLIKIKTFEEIDSYNFPTTKLISEIIEHQKDGEPDIYYYNFGDFRGSFFFDSNKNPHFLNEDKRIINIKLSIKQNDNYIYIAQFEITDNKGFKYLFSYGDGEITESYSKLFGFNISTKYFGLYAPLVNSKKEQTSWYLTSISSPKGNYIKFNYVNETICQESSLSGILYYIRSANKWLCTDYSLYSPLQQYYSSNFLSRKQVTNYTKKLYKITTNKNITIYFSRDTKKRIDLPTKDFSNKDISSYPLSNIFVFIDNIRVLDWHFGYEYFSSDKIKEKKYDPDPIETNWYYRLKLKSLRQIGNNAKLGSPYIFYYYGENKGEAKLPHRYSYSCKDFMGYCNDKATYSNSNNPAKIFPNTPSTSYNYHLKNSYIFYPSLNYSFDFRYIYNYADIYLYAHGFNQGSNKNANINYAKAFSLKQIVYPTKGSTKFEYELHDISFIGSELISSEEVPQNMKIGGLRIKKIINTPEKGKPIIKEYFYNRAHNKNISSGVISNFPFWINPKRFVYLKYNQYFDYFTLSLNSNTINSLSKFGGSYIEYKRVEERQNNGATKIYEYTTHADPPFKEKYESRLVGLFKGKNQITFAAKMYAPFYPFNDNSHSKYYGVGKIKKITYKKNDKVVRQELFDYSFIDKSKVYCAKAYEFGEANLRLNIFYIQTGIARLKTKTETNYFNNGKKTIVTNYEYDNDELLTKKTVNNGKKILTTTYSYPKEVLYPKKIITDKTKEYHGTWYYDAINKMVSIGNISQPIEITNYVNDKVIGSKLYIFETFHDFSTGTQYIKYNHPHFVVLYNIMKLKLEKPVTNFSPFYVAPRTGDFDSRYETVLSFKYNYAGLIKQYRYSNDISTFIMWDRYRRNPIIIIKNSSASSLAYFLGYNNVYNLNIKDIYVQNNNHQTIKQTEITSQYLIYGKYKLSIYAKRIDSKDHPNYVILTGNKIKMVKLSNDEINYFETEITISHNNFELFFNNATPIYVMVVPLGVGVEQYKYRANNIIEHIDENNKKTNYTYDSFNRLIRITDNDGNILKQIEYNYKK